MFYIERDKPLDVATILSVVNQFRTKELPRLNK